MKQIRLQQVSTKPEIVLAHASQPMIEHPSQALIRMLCVGLDGTDREILQEQYGTPPDGEDELVFGHESLGVVMEAGPSSGLAPGDLVTALVRRPCIDLTCVNCRNDRSDYCETGRFVERGINGAHGFLSEFVVEESRYLVKLPTHCLEYGVFAEPQSIVEKVWNQVQRVQQRLIWQPKHAIILGAGPLGLLAAATCRTLGLHTYVWSKGSANSYPAQLVQQMGAQYQQADVATPDYSAAASMAERLGQSDQSDQSDQLSQSNQPGSLREYVQQLGVRVDMIMECTGHSPLAFEAMGAVGPGGVVALLGVSSGSGRAEIEVDRLNLDIVVHNKSVVGSVNASRRDFETGIHRMQQIERLCPGLLSSMITNRYRLDEVPQLDFRHVGLKAVVDITPPDEWGRWLGPASDEAHSMYGFTV